MDLNDYLRDVPDFPKPGIVFKDISPLLASAEAFAHCIDRMAAETAKLGAEHIAGVESRGFLFGTPLAQRLGLGFSPIRKPGKLPWETVQVEYQLEYGSDSLEIHNDGVKPGQKVLIIDDVLATGGTAQAAAELVELIGGEVAGFGFLLELGFLQGRSKLGGRPTFALLGGD